MKHRADVIDNEPVVGEISVLVELDDFISEIATESMTALERKSKKRTEILKPGAARMSKKKPKKENVEIGSFPQAAFANIIRETMENLPSEGITFRMVDHSRITEEGLEELPVVDYHTPRSRWYDPAMLLLDSNEPVWVKAADFFNLEKAQEGTTRMKLLKVWMTICEFVVEKFTERTGKEFSWGFGWVFAPKAFAQQYTQDNIHYFLLNPVNEDGKMRYSINKRESLSEMIITAAHEISHLVGDGWHNEEFAESLTNLAIDCMRESSEIYRRIKETK